MAGIGPGTSAGESSNRHAVFAGGAPRTSTGPPGQNLDSRREDDGERPLADLGWHQVAARDVSVTADATKRLVPVPVLADEQRPGVLRRAPRTEGMELLPHADASPHGAVDDP